MFFSQLELRSFREPRETKNKNNEKYFSKFKSHNLLTCQENHTVKSSQNWEDGNDLTWASLEVTL